MSGNMPKEGDFFIVKSWSRYEIAGPILKVTAKQVRHPDRWGTKGRESRTDIGQIIWFGPEAEGKSLTEKLTSSAALKRSEERGATERHEARIAKLIGKVNP